MPRFEIDNNPELTTVDLRWLESHGHGHRCTLYRKIKDGRLPQPDFKDPRMKWRLSTLRKHFEELQGRESA